MLADFQRWEIWAFLNEENSSAHPNHDKDLVFVVQAEASSTQDLLLHLCEVQVLESQIATKADLLGIYAHYEKWEAL